MTHTHEPRIKTDAEDAAGILREYKKRIERLEETDAEGGETVQLYRQANETVVASDTTNVMTDDDPGFEWDTSQWGFDEWDVV